MLYHRGDMYATSGEEMIFNRLDASRGKPPGVIFLPRSGDGGRNAETVPEVFKSNRHSFDEMRSTGDHHAAESKRKCTPFLHYAEYFFL